MSRHTSNIHKSGRLGRLPARWWTLISIGVLTPTFVFAQVQKLTIEPLTGGSKEVVVTIDPPKTGLTVNVNVTGRPVGIGTQNPDTAGSKYKFPLDVPLVAGDQITVSVEIDNVPFSGSTMVLPTYDERGIFDASAYLGSAFDNFAASGVKEYINPKGTSDTQERFIFGFDFEYRLFGKV